MDLKTKASIRLIDAIRVHGFFKSDTTKVFRNGQTKGRPPDMPHEALNESINVLSVNEGHFDVHLGKFRLAIGTQVLLRGLRQCVALRGVDSTWDEKFARPFGGGFEQRWGLDFQKALFFHEHTGSGCHLAAQP